jgi:hypothetical protein
MSPAIALPLMVLLMVVMWVSSSNAESSYEARRYQRAQGFGLICMGAAIMMLSIVLSLP